MQDLLVLCEEIGGDELAEFRKFELEHQFAPEDPEAAVAVKSPKAAVAVETPTAAVGVEAQKCAVAVEGAQDEIADELITALQWTTGITEGTVLATLATSLPLVVKHEQMVLYKNRTQSRN